MAVAIFAQVVFLGVPKTKRVGGCAQTCDLSCAAGYGASIKKMKKRNRVGKEEGDEEK